MGGTLERIGIAACLLLLCAAAAHAQTATPTPTPQACLGSERVRLLWKASTRQGKVFVRLNQCDPPVGCDGGATPLITAPITLRIEDAAGKRITGVLPVQDFVKSDFCPGGHETFELELGKLRYVFGSEGVTNVVLKTSMLINDPPLLTPPVRLSLTDAGGYSLGTAFAECTVRDSGTLVQVRCDDTTRYLPPASTPEPSPTSNAAPTRTPIPTRTTISTRTPVL